MSLRAAILAGVAVFGIGLLGVWQAALTATVFASRLMKRT